MRPSIRLGAIVAVLVLVAACDATATPGIDATDLPSASQAVVPTASVPAPAPAPTSTPTSTSSQEPSPSPPPSLDPTPTGEAGTACPADGSTASIEQLLAQASSCLPRELVVTGWWDRRHSDDGPEDLPFWDFLRERVPVADPEVGLDTVPSIPLVIGELDRTRLDGRWATLRVRIAHNDTQCYWDIPQNDDPSPSNPPTLVCPTFATVLSARAVAPPAGALDACPNLANVIRVADFVRYPRACFDGTEVRLAGWLDTDDPISGWEAPWEIEPAWLWSITIGPRPVLSPSSNASDPEALRLHVQPGSTIERVTQNQWVILRGHYARAAEYGACHYVYPSDWFGGPNPIAGTLNDADARANCANAFVAVSARSAERP
jgi:hypothetical protein